MIYTYIIITYHHEYYCGITHDIKRKLKEHKSEKYPHWFSFKRRKHFTILYVFRGNYEKKIKKFGIKNFCDMLKENIILRSSPP